MIDLRFPFDLWFSRMLKAGCVGGACLMAGCATVVYDGEPHDAPEIGDHDTVRVLMPPFFNATNDDHAGRALTELTGSALIERGVPLYQTEEFLISSQAETAAGPDGRYQELAGTVGATHLLVGTVHEYRYKTDLDGDPAVGVTIRLVEARTGRTVWQGSSSNIGYAFASVTSASQKAVRRLVRRMPISRWDFDENESAPSAGAEKPQSEVVTEGARDSGEMPTSEE